MSGARKVAAFCSANSAIDEAYFAAAGQLAEGVARRGWELLYGAASGGLMGRMADRGLACGGVVRGATTSRLAAGREGVHDGLHEIVIVADLFARKRWLMDHADAFVVLPGGLGTLDEAIEVMTWKSLGEMQKPITFVNVNGFWQSQLNVFENLQKSGMVRPGGLELYEVRSGVAEVLTDLDNYFGNTTRPL